MQQGLTCVKTGRSSTKLVRLWLSLNCREIWWQGRKAKPKQIAVFEVTDMRLTPASALRLDLNGRWKEFLLPDSSIVTWYTGLQSLNITTLSPFSTGQCIVRKAVLRLRRESGKQDFGPFLLNQFFSPPKARGSFRPLSTECSSAVSRSSRHFDLQLSDCELSDQEEESIPEPKTSPSCRSLNARGFNSERSVTSPDQSRLNHLFDLISTLIKQNQTQKTALIRLSKENKDVKTRLQAAVLQRKARELREVLLALRLEAKSQYEELMEVWPHVIQLIAQHIEKAA